MKYVIMCGGKYGNFETPKQFTKIKGERIVDRTIRLLRENGIDDIVITSNNPVFDSCGVKRVEDKRNDFSQDKSWTNMKGWWLDAFHDFNEPCCYLFGDVCYSERAMKLIIESNTDTSLLFGSNPTSSEGYLVKTWYEPFAFKVVDFKTFFKGIREVKSLYEKGKVNRHPIAWELYRHLNGLDINSNAVESHFVCINDYTTDIDNVNVRENDVERIEYFMDKEQGKHRELSKCFGVVSYIPDAEPARSLRIERLNRMFNRVHELFGDVDWIIIAQNWKDYKYPNVLKNVRVYRYEKMGILLARKTLGKRFLESKYDYLIMLDDDAIIEVDGPLIAQAYMDEINLHPNMYMFLQYKEAQLNMCAISRYVYEREPMVDVDPQKDEGYEDTVYSNLLKYKHHDWGFDTMHGIRCTQFRNKNEKAPSTWSNGSVDHKTLWLCTEQYLRNFEKGIFTLDKNEVKNKAKLRDKLKKMLFNGWINKEDVKRFYGIDLDD